MVPANSLTKSQRRLLVSIYHYLVACRIIDYSKSQLSELLDVPSADLPNLIDRAGVKGSSALYGLVRDALEENSKKVDEHIIPIVLQVYGDQIDISAKYTFHPSDILKVCISDDAEYLEEISERYAGVYKVFRYAAHSAAAGLPNNSPSVILASLEIRKYQDGDSHLNFEIRYRPRQKRGIHHSRVIGGVAIIKDYLYFVGREELTGFPLVMATKTEEDISGQIFSMVFRFHEFKHTFLSSRVLLKKTNCSSISELNGFIGRFKEDMIDSDEVNLDDIVNHVKHGGKSALLL